MERPARPLPLLGGAVVVTVIALSLWIATRGPRAGMGIDVARAMEFASESEVIATTPDDLPIPAASATTARTEIIEPIDGAADENGIESDPRALCCVKGVMLLPPTFPGGAPATINAWPAGEESGSAPAEEEVTASDTWRIADLMPGKWVFVARAEINGRIAWGRSQEIELVENVAPDLVRILLTEYYISGQVTDAIGMPIAGLPVSYEWDGTEEYAGDMMEVSESSEVRFISAGTFQIFSGAVGTLSGDQIRATDEVTIQFIQSAAQIEGLQIAPGTGLTAVTGGFQESGTFEGSEEIELPTIQPYESSIFQEITSRVGEIVVTGPDGRFHIALEGPGRVNVAAPLSGYTVAPGSTRWLTESTSVEVSTDAPMASVEFALLRTATIRGHLLRSDGNAADSVNVFLRRIGAGSTDADTTASDGTFQFESCRPGEHLFYARSGGSSGQDYSVHSRIVVNEGDEFILDEILMPSSSVTGVVMDESNSPVEGATITATGAENNNLNRTAKTDASGRFTIVGMYGTDYTLAVGGRQLLEKATVSVLSNGDRVDIGALVVLRLARD